MSTLYITQALPNPPGKDRPPHSGPSDDQLNGEWLEFKNVSTNLVNLVGVQVLHRAYNAYCQHTGDMIVTSFGQGALAGGNSIRIHTGSGKDHWNGSVLHFYLGRSNYIWNNRCGDAATLAISNGTIDWAYYAGNPSEGKVLFRLPGNQLA